ncbi:MAG: hypothetical protein H7Y04_01350 [Verrucomicrobia bacterium]|nr:hypothetical protein [Cytophagales bacterium]
MRILDLLFGKKNPVKTITAIHENVGRRAMERIAENSLNFRYAWRTADLYDENLPESFLARRSYPGNSS